MPSVLLDDIEVQFPHVPYDIQINLMTCVIQCIKNREHGLLESPTGTGKTASLLCASLAWQRNEKELVRKSIQGGANPGFSSKGINDPTNAALQNISRVPKIIYATRTHSQIGQAVGELKRSAYNRVKTVTLGSREMMCIHDEVSRIAESTTKNMACHMKVLARSCAYHNNVQKMKEQLSIGLGNQPAMDIEEMVAKGRGHRFCPFFMSKEMGADADLIFMPYNYLLDPKLRASHGVDLKGCIIILDEAHNITKVCEESSSFELRSSMIAQCLRETTKALNEYNEMTEELKKSAKELTLGEIVKLKSNLLDLEKNLDEADFCLDIPENGKTIQGAEVLKCFFASGFTIVEFGRWIRVLDGVSSFLATNFTEATGCDKFSGVLRVLSTRLLYGHPELFLNSYAVKVELETKTHGPGPSNTLTGFVKPKGKVFHFWCLNPAVGLDLLLSHLPRCVMLASGTLSPIEFLENELQMHFPVKIQNPHIITDKQLYAAVLKTGPGDVKLSSAFQNRGKTEYLISLGEVIRSACAAVPEGVLVFFPSYSAMDQAVGYWKENEHWSNIAADKSVHVEPRGKRALDDLINNYYTDCDRGSGSCLMAVCRGKVSEGLDFTDSKCRLVIITGLPYAPYQNEQVKAKKSYLDSKFNSSKGIRGDAWYNIDAVRALNQAVGRIIRHKNDFGAILLCDERCDYANAKQNMSSWVTSRLVRPTYTDMISQLKLFFQSTSGSGQQVSVYSRSSFSRPSQSGSSFEFNTQSKSYTVRVKEDVPKIFDAPEVLFEDLYGGDEDLYRSRSASKKSSGSQGSGLSRLQSIGATTPTVSFHAPVSKPSSSSSSNSSSMKQNGSTSSAKSCTDGRSHPSKKIKLVSQNTDPTKYTRIADNRKHVGVIRSGETVHHVISTAARKELAARTQIKTPVFKPLFSSTQSPVKKVEAKTFDTPAAFGLWVKSKLNDDNYRKVMTEFKNYNQHSEVTKLLDFGKKMFPDSIDYMSYVNGLRLVVKTGDRVIISDIISAYQDFD